MLNVQLRSFRDGIRYVPIRSTYIWLTLTLMHFDTDIADRDRKRETKIPTKELWIPIELLCALTLSCRLTSTN